MSNFESDYTQIGPDISPERMRGAYIRRNLHYFHLGLETLRRLDDVTIRTGEGFLEPGKSCYGIAFVPKDYFPEEFLRLLSPNLDPAETASLYLKYLLDRKLTSTKSKLAQSCWEIQADFGMDPYLKFPVETNDRGYYFPMWIRNLNPKVTFLTPNKPFPAFRFFIPGKPMRGQKLATQAKLMRNPGILLEDENDNCYPTDEDIEPSQLTSVIVPIEREGEFTGKKIVQVQDLLDCPSSDRPALDKIWGLKWKTSVNIGQELVWEEVQISESGPLVMPSGVAGVIDYRENWLDTIHAPRSPEHGIFRHISSPLIDPGFGLPSGQPIRFEHYSLAVRNNPKIVRMNLYQSN